MNRKALGLGWMAALLLVANAGAQTKTVIKDQFGSKDRVAGLTINKTPTESGDAVWQATPNVMLGGKGDTGYVEVNSDKPFMGRLSIPPTAKIITVEAKLRAEPHEKSNWLAIGIGNPHLGTPPWGLGVCLIYYPGGSWGCLGDTEQDDYTSKAIVNIKRGTIPEYNPDDFNRFKLEYNRAENTVSAWINNEQVLDDESLAGRELEVVPAFAGFSGFGQKADTPAVSDVTVTYQQ